MADELTEPSQVAYSRPSPPRQIVGWVFLCLIFSALITLEAISYFGRKPSQPLAALEGRLESAVEARKVGSLESGSTESLDNVIASLDKLRPKNDDAERMWIVATFEKAHQVPTGDIDRLRKASVKDGPTLAEIYSKPKLTKPQANELVKLLDDDSRFSTQLAESHAKEKAGLPDGRNHLPGGQQMAAGFFLGFIVLAGSGLWIVFLVLKASGALPAAGHPAEPLTVPQADAFAMRTAQFLAAFVVVSFLAGMIPLGDKTPLEVKAGLGIFAQLVALVVALRMARNPVDGESISLRRLGFRSDKPGRDILYGLCATAMNYPVLLGLGFISRIVFRSLPEAEHPITAELAGRPSLLLVALLLVGASIVAPIFEEMVFRGAFLPAVTRVLKSRAWGVVITSVLFATIHPTGIPAWPGLAALGAMGCLLTIQTKSLLPAMVMHGMNNAISLIVTVLIGS